MLSVREDVIGEDFKEVFVKQAGDAIFAEMCKEPNVTNYHHIQKFQKGGC